ncbi:MAG: hypothetical protein ACFFBH_04985 [Promethearchaeota archaeon]
MFYTNLDDLIFYQCLKFIRKYSNFELKLFHYFYNKTKIYPKNIIIINHIIFFFVNNEDYFEAKSYLHALRLNLCKKVALIRSENVLINLIHSFFPDIYIHDIRVEYNIYSHKREITVNLLTFEERGIAVGKNGDYIKAINELIEKYIEFQKFGKPLKITCKVTRLFTTERPLNQLDTLLY